MTDPCNRWPKYLLEQAIAPPPEGCKGLIVPNSTPVVSFGNPVRATVATISLNPSKKEFSGSSGLAMLPLPEAESYKDLKREHGAMILDGCSNYFEKKPNDWFFSPLDCILRAGARASYYADARPDARYLSLACHLDLSPWATSDSWSDLKKSDSKKRKNLNELKNKGIPFLDEHICYGKYSLVLVNGIEAKESITIKGNLIEWVPVSHSEDPKSIKFFKARHFDTLFLAWRFGRYGPGFIQYELRHLPALARFVARCYDEFQNERRTT